MRPRGGQPPARGATASAPLPWPGWKAVKATSVPTPSCPEGPGVDDVSPAPIVRLNPGWRAPEAPSGARSALRAEAPQFEPKSTLSASAPCFTPPLVKFATALFPITEGEEKPEDPVEKEKALAEDKDPRRREGSEDSPSRMTRNLSETRSAPDTAKAVTSRNWRRAVAASPPVSALTQEFGHGRTSEGSLVASRRERSPHLERQAIQPVQTKRGAAGRKARTTQQRCVRSAPIPSNQRRRSKVDNHRTRQSSRRRPTSNRNWHKRRGAPALSTNGNQRCVLQDPTSGKICTSESAPGSGRRRAPVGVEHAPLRNAPPTWSRNYFWALEDSPNHNESISQDDNASARTSRRDRRAVCSARPSREKPSSVRSPDHAGYAWAQPLSKSDEAELLDRVCPLADREVLSKSRRRHLRRKRAKASVKDVQVDSSPAPSVPPSTEATTQGFAALSKPPARAEVPRHPDTLRDWAAANAEFLAQHGYEALVKERRGRSNLNPDVGSLNHPAAGYLDYIRRHGAPVVSTTPPKTPEELQAAVDRGPHPSAEAHADFLAQEAFEMCQRHHTFVLPFSAVKHLPGVEISPPGVIDQRDRRPRTISDLTYSGVNQSTVDLTVNESMQFGRALRRILLNIYRADPRWGPVYMLKADISDGFYNIWVNANGSRRLGLILPSKQGEDPLVLFFLALPMGWVSSPPVFCTATEVATDIANKEIASNWRPPPHRQENAADTEGDIDPARGVSVQGNPPRIRQRNKGPLGYVDCYVDDFMALVQGSKRRRRRVRRILFHCIDRVFRAPDDKDGKWTKDKISLKKLLKGDGSLTTLKIILGWLVDTVAGTIELPPHRVERLFAMLDSFPIGRKTCPKRDLHKLIGELRSMLIAIPGGVGCISWLQETLKTAGERVYLNQHFHDAVADFRWLAQDISNRPTRIAEVVPEVPAVVGMSDAAGPGMGGVWLPDGDRVYLASLRPSLVPALDTEAGESVTAAVEARDAVARSTGLPPAPDGTLLSEPLLWRHPFPDDIQAELVSDSNPKGSINNSELELAGILAHNDVLANAVDVQETTTATGTDNTSGLGWSTRGAISATTPASYLLRLNSMHQRQHRYQQRNFYIPGLTNKMADDCSRLWNLTDDELVSYFNSTYPQHKSWRLCQLSANTASAIHSALRCERKPLPTTLDALTAEHMHAGRDTSGAGTPPRRLDVSPSMHGHRKMLYHSLGSRSKSWANNIYHGRRQVPQVYPPTGINPRDQPPSPTIYYDGASPPPSACDSAIESELRPATSGLPRVQRGWPTELGESPGGRCSLHRGLVPAQSRLEESGTTNSVEAEGRTATLSRPYRW
mmetsp:Transcript_36392/g.81833  ORF Transcript_36392/g.81833 Transcript_36392/m.81833 type:complete len:1331 (-) Transcript_36392:274-4266(-)